MSLMRQIRNNSCFVWTLNIFHHDSCQGKGINGNLSSGATSNYSKGFAVLLGIYAMWRGWKRVEMTVLKKKIIFPGDHMCIAAQLP